MSITLLLLGLLGIIMIGVPISFALGITSLAILLTLPEYSSFLHIVPQRMFSGINQFAIMAMPFFMFAGSLMNRSTITGQLVRLSESFVGHIRGGLAHVNICSSMLFAGLTGSAVADTAALGSVLIPAMVKSGYSKGFSAAVTAASSIIGPIIPPSIIMVIYGSLMGVSIAGMFAAGIIPGILLGISLMVVSYFISVKRDYPKQEVVSFTEIVAVFKKSIVALFMPVIILGGILGGVFTPTEAAAVGVLYALVAGLLMKKLSLKDIWESLKETAESQGMVLMILSCAGILSWLLASEKVPEQIANVIISITTNKICLLLIINIILLIVGMFMDITAALIILAPIMAPLAISAGVHPLHFGIIMVINLNIGLISPPLGACLFVAGEISDTKLENVVKEILPFILVEIVVLFFLTYCEPLVLAIPRILGFV